METHYRNSSLHIRSNQLVHVVRAPLELLRASWILQLNELVAGVQLVEIVTINLVAPRALLGRASYSACSLKMFCQRR